jgi:TPR repeat protein
MERGQGVKPSPKVAFANYMLAAKRGFKSLSGLQLQRYNCSRWRRLLLRL